MKKFIFVFLVLLAFILQQNIFAQKEYYNWCFGQHTGLTFNTDNFVPKPIGSMLFSYEGCSSISDKNGKLLFYTDGVTVWTQNYQIMANGGSLLGCGHATQSSLIIKKPGDDSLYYIFTLDAIDTIPTLRNVEFPFCLPYDGMNYSIVNIKRKNGLGEVVVKNVFLYTPSTEKMCAVRHCNTHDIWIVTHQLNTNGFVSYLVDKNGLNPLPVISNTGDIFKMPDAGGYMKASSDGLKLAVARLNTGIYLYDFDKTSGTVSNQQVVEKTDTVNNLINGCEFSPDGTNLFYTIFGKQELDKVYNIASKSKRLLYKDDNSSGELYPAYQLGPDGKIYITIDDKNYMNVISNPNSDTKCIFEYDGLLIWGSCEDGLPNMINDFLYIMKDTTLCEGDDLNFYPFPNTGTYKWSGPNGFTSNTANLSLHNVNPSMSGIYTVEGFTPCAFIDTFNITINPKPTTVIFPSDTIQVCSGTQVLLMVKPYIKGENYSWQDGSVQSTFLAKSTGKYTLVASNKYNCTKYSEVYISYYPKPPVKIIANSVSCVLDSVILTAQPASANYSYLWSTGENTKSIVVNKPAKYYLTVTDSLGCKNTDSITIKENLSVSITANGPLTLCKGDSVVLSASPIDSSYTYKWNTGETTTAITVNKPGIYTVIASLGDKCSDTASVTIENGYPTNLIINHNGPVTFCEGDSVILFAATSLPVISYEWSTGEISDSIIVNKSGTYKLVVQNSFGCRDSAEIDIQVIQEFDAEITGNLNFCEGQSTVLSAEPIGIAYNYLWSTGDTTQTITVNKSGLYTLVVSLNNSCIDSTTVNVTVYPLPIVQISGDSMLCPGRTSILLVQNDFPSYLWSTGETTKQINITQIGTYSVRVTDIYGCEDSTSIEVKQFDINLTGLVDIDFGTILSGASVQLKNESNTEIEIKDIYVKNQKNIFSITTNPALPLNLNIGSTTDIDVTFNRDMIKDYSDSVFIEIDKPCPSIIGAALKGSAKAITTIFLPNLTANVGQPNLCIPLTAKKDAGMTINDTLSYNAEIRFDASALYPYDTYPIIAGDWVIKLSGNNILFNNNEIELGNFCGVVLLANQDNTPLRITNFAWNNTNIEKTIIDGSLTVKGICQPDLARIRLFTPLQLQIIPNPSNELSVISYKLSEEGNVKLTLVSCLGQEVAILVNENQKAGEHSYQLSVNSYQLSEGVYFVKLAASGSIETEKMMIVK